MEERSADPILQRRQHGQGATNAIRQEAMQEAEGR